MSKARHHHWLPWRGLGFALLALLAVAPWLLPSGDGGPRPAIREQVALGRQVLDQPMESAPASVVPQPQRIPSPQVVQTEFAAEEAEEDTDACATLAPCPELLNADGEHLRPLGQDEAAPQPPRDEPPAAPAQPPPPAPPPAVPLAAPDVAAAPDAQSTPEQSPWIEPPTVAAPAPVAVAAAPAARSQQLERIAQEADRKTRHAFELAGRGAQFAARAEFIAALRMVAQGLDQERNTAAHSRALAAGLTALKEADDFLPRGARLEADLDLPALIAGHRTPALKDRPADAVAPVACLRSYLSFAQAQLAAGCDAEIAGSMALHGLGKLYTSFAEGKAPQVSAAEAKAVAFFQAAVLVCPENHLAANELGVLLARCGNLPDAQRMLEHSIALQQHPAVWRNLATVYEQAGWSEWAQYAAQQSQIAAQAEALRGVAAASWAGQPVRWVEPSQFAGPSGGTLAPVASPPAIASPVATPTYPAPMVTRRPAGPPPQAGWPGGVRRY